MKLQNRCNCSSSADCSDFLESLLVAWQPRGDNKTAESLSVWLLYAKKQTAPLFGLNKGDRLELTDRIQHGGYLPLASRSGWEA